MSFSESLADIVAENRNKLLGIHGSWERVRLGDVVDIQNGFPFPSEQFSSSPQGTPLIRIRDILRSSTETYFLGEYPSEFLVEPGALLIGMDGDFNVAIWRGTPALLNQRCCRLAIRSRHLEARFLAYCLLGYLAAINAHTSAITVKHLSSRTVADIPLPLPPVEEQKRIADALDELLSDLDAGAAALERVRAKLKHYRAAVLKAAVEGALTAEWWLQHPATETADALLTRILAERRRRWAEAQLAKLEATGKTPPDNWRTRYPEPAPAPTGLPDLPPGWCWATLDQLLWQLRSGSSETSGRTPTDFPVLKSSAVRPGRIDLADLNYLAHAQSERPENFLERNDILITRLSGSAEYVGCCAVVGDLGGQRIQFPDRIFCGKLVNILSGTYLTYAFSYPRVRRELESAAKSTAGHKRISISDLLPLAVPVPPLDEQEAIFDAVEDQLSVIDHLEHDLERRLTGAQSLRQSILRHAFTGQLVPQDPNDEPASELLKRIAVEREERSRLARAAKQAASRTRMPRGRAKKK